jgi:hypothetical protein
MAPEFGRQITPFMYQRFEKNERIMKRAHMQTIPIVDTNVVNRPGSAEGGLFVGTVRLSTHYRLHWLKVTQNDQKSATI